MNAIESEADNLNNTLEDSLRKTLSVYSILYFKHTFHRLKLHPGRLKDWEWVPLVENLQRSAQDAPKVGA